MLDSPFRAFQWLIALLLVSLGPSIAASTNQVTVDNTTIAASTTYTVTFKAAQSIGSGADSINFNTNGGADVSAATFLGVSGGSGLVITQTATTANVIVLNVAAGSAIAGDILSLEIANVVNPSSEGQGPDYTVGQIDGLAQPPIPVFITLPGTVYTGSSAPVVVNPIDDLIGEGNALVEGDPAFEASSDLSTVFEDADMDPLTFSLEPGTDPAVLNATITGDDRLLISPVGSGTTSVAVRATSGDGSAIDSFDVQVIGLLDNAVMTPADLAVGETTSYSLTFNAAGAITAGQNILVITGAAGPDYRGASLSISGGSLAGSLPLPSDQAFRVSIDSGSAAAGAPITITLSNVINPASAGLGPDYSIRVTDSALQLIDRGVASGNIFEAGGAPFVVNPIADQSLNEIDGASTVVGDISTVFDEDDGDTITYAVLAGNDPQVATAALVANGLGGQELIVTPTGPGDTTISVEASDVDGAITDSFDVSVRGLMDNASFAPVNNSTGTPTNYEFSFTTSTALDSGFVLIIRNLGMGGPDYSAAQLFDFSGGSLIMDFNAGDDTQLSISISGGTASVGEPISFTLSNVFNPATGGTGPDYQSELLRLDGGTIVESALIDGSEFEAPVDPVFDDRFQASAP